jgi:hypothetical protein
MDGSSLANGSYHARKNLQKKRMELTTCRQKGCNSPQNGHRLNNNVRIQGINVRFLSGNMSESLLFSCTFRLRSYSLLKSLLPPLPERGHGGGGSAPPASIPPGYRGQSIRARRHLPATRRGTLGLENRPSQLRSIIGLLYHRVIKSQAIFTRARGYKLSLPAGRRSAGSVSTSPPSRAAPRRDGRGTGNVAQDPLSGPAALSGRRESWRDSRGNPVGAGRKAAPPE